jgi:hypothetical protein
MTINLYPPVNCLPGQELAPSPPWRVASGSLSLISRRFFINQNPYEGKLIKVSLPIMFQIYGKPKLHSKLNI